MVDTDDTRQMMDDRRQMTAMLGVRHKLLTGELINQNLNMFQLGPFGVLGHPVVRPVEVV